VNDYLVEINVEMTWFFFALFAPWREKAFHAKAQRAQRKEFKQLAKFSTTDSHINIEIKIRNGQT